MRFTKIIVLLLLIVYSFGVMGEGEQHVTLNDDSHCDCSPCTEVKAYDCATRSEEAGAPSGGNDALKSTEE